MAQPSKPTPKLHQEGIPIPLERRLANPAAPAGDNVGGVNVSRSSTPGWSPIPRGRREGALLRIAGLFHRQELGFCQSSLGDAQAGESGEGVEELGGRLFALEETLILPNEGDGSFAVLVEEFHP